MVRLKGALDESCPANEKEVGGQQIRVHVEWSPHGCGCACVRARGSAEEFCSHGRTFQGGGNDRDRRKARTDFHSFSDFCLKITFEKILQHAIRLFCINLQKLQTETGSHLRVMAPFQVLRLHNMADPLQIQFIYSFIYFESANSFTLTDSRRARRLLKTLTWTITGGPFMKSNNYAYFDRRHSWVQKQCYSQARAFVSALELPDQIPPSWWIFS